MRTSIIICAAGKSERWESDTPKQLVEIDNEKLLIRTADMASCITDTYYVATDNILIIQALPEHYRLGGHIYRPPHKRWLVETIYSTLPIWEDRVIILLGDVYYDSIDFGEIVSYQSGITFFGRDKEVFAVSFSREHYKEICHRLKQTILESLSGRREGRLSDLLDCSDLDCEFCKLLYSQDFDRAIEFNEFLERRQVENPAAE